MSVQTNQFVLPDNRSSGRRHGAVAFGHSDETCQQTTACRAHIDSSALASTLGIMSAAVAAAVHSLCQHTEAHGDPHLDRTHARAVYTTPDRRSSRVWRAGAFAARRIHESSRAEDKAQAPPSRPHLITFRVWEDNVWRWRRRLPRVWLSLSTITYGPAAWLVTTKFH